MIRNTCAFILKPLKVNNINTQGVLTFVVFLLTSLPITLNAQGLELSTIFGEEGSPSGNSRLGAALQCIGDFGTYTGPNVVIGAPGDLGDTGLIRIISPSDPGTDLFTTSGTTGEKVGASISELADIDSDGDPELLVGVPGYLNGAYGQVQIRCSNNPGTASTIDSTYGTTFYGYAEAIAGLQSSHVIAVALPNYNQGNIGPGDTNCGALEIISFTPSDCTNLNTLDRTLIYGDCRANDELLGTSLDRVGDVMSSSFSSLGEGFIAGAPGYAVSPSFDALGAFYIFAFNSSWNVQATVTGEQADEKFGHSVSSVGDLNGDNYDEFIVGAPKWDDTTLSLTDSGRALLFSGASIYDSPPVPLCELIPYDAESADQFGYAVRGVGDVNDDSLPDFAVSAVGKTANTGKVYVYTYDPGVDACSLLFEIYPPSGTPVDYFFGSNLTGNPTGCDLNNDLYDDIGVSGNVDNVSNNDGSFYFYAGMEYSTLTPTPTYTPDFTQTPTATPTPSATPTETPVPAPTATVTPTATATSIPFSKKIVPPAPEVAVTKAPDAKRAQADVLLAAFSLKKLGAKEAITLASKVGEEPVTVAGRRRVRTKVVLRGRLVRKNGKVTKKRVTKKTTTRKTKVTFKKLRPGNYKVKYRGEKVKSGGRKEKVTGSTQFSPRTSFTVR